MISFGLMTDMILKETQTPLLTRQLSYTSKYPSKVRSVEDGNLSKEASTPSNDNEGLF